MMRQLCGAKLDVIRPITQADRAGAFHTTTLFAATDPASQVVDLTDAHTWRAPQGSADCVEYSHVSQAYDLAKMQGNPLPDFPSASHIYARTQLRQGLITPGVGLNNTGSACGWALAEMIEQGAPAEKDYPDTGENGSRVPPLAAFELPPICKVNGAHRVIFEDATDSNGQDAREAKLMQDLSVAFAAAKAGTASMLSGCMLVDDAYGNLPVGQVYDATGGTVWGGHCQLMVLFDPIRKLIGFADSWLDPTRRRVYLVSIPWYAKFGGGVFIQNGVTRLA